MFSWKNRRVLITGISGFVGSHLARELTRKGADVFGISRDKEGKHIHKASIINKSAIEEIVSKYHITTLFHLAGEVLVEAGQKDPYKTFQTNIMGTLNVLEICREKKLERIIISSSSHVYGKNETPYKETYPAKPSRPYETSKAAADMIAQSYADSFNLPVLIPRFVNIYGPGDQNFTRLIPRTFQSIFTQKPIALWGGNSLREYLYVDDAINAYVKLAEIDNDLIESNRIFNFGTGKVISVKEIVQHIIDLSGQNVLLEKIPPQREDEITTQFVSSAKAVRVLGWKPEIALDSGLQRTLDWYKAYFQK